MAFSGGADSVLAAHRAVNTGNPVTVWYLHHYTTDPEPERLTVFEAVRKKYPEMEWLKAKADISRVAKRMGYSWEHTASLVRRKRLMRLSRLKPDTRIVTGHNYSDFLETLALRRDRKIPEIFLPALAEHDKTTGFWRPLYQMTREEVRHELRALGLPFFDDPANKDEKFARNRIRKALALREENPLSAKKALETPAVLQPVQRSAGMLRELRVNSAVWSKLSPTDKARTVFSAFRCLAIVRRFTRAHFSRAQRLPFVLPPFFAETENTPQGASVIFRRGLGEDVKLPQPLPAPHLRGNRVSRKISIAQKYGHKSIAKIFSEKKLSLRQRRLALVYLTDDTGITAKRIVFHDGTEMCGVPV